jgi:hypothetical protein
VSKDGVVTEISFKLPMYNNENIPFDYEDIFEKDTLWVVGKEFDRFDSSGKPRKTFCHKKDLNLSTVFCEKGYKSTYVWEDKFEPQISFYRASIRSESKLSN